MWHEFMISSAVQFIIKWYIWAKWILIVPVSNFTQCYFHLWTIYSVDEKYIDYPKKWSLLWKYEYDIQAYSMSQKFEIQPRRLYSMKLSLYNFNEYAPLLIWCGESLYYIYRHTLKNVRCVLCEFLLYFRLNTSIWWITEKFY